MTLVLENITKEEAIQYLWGIKEELLEGINFKGRTKLIRDIDQKIRYLSLYYVSGNIPRILVNDIKKKVICA